MGILNIAFIILVIAIILKVLTPFLNASQSITLRKKMVRLNPIKGKSYLEITQVAGTPTVTEIKGGGKMCSWNSQKYAINLGFDKDNICTGVFGEKIMK